MKTTMIETIKSEVARLTEQEIEVLKFAKCFEYIYGVGIIIVKLLDSREIIWDCCDSITAKNYLENLNIPEIQ